MELTEKQKAMLRGEICPYCEKETEYIDSIEVYGISYGMIFICRDCDAYVGVHYGYSGESKGRLANKKLRYWKKQAHDYFDRIWRGKRGGRNKAYKWLSESLGLPPEYTHIGMFGVNTCKKVVDLCKERLNITE